MSLHDSGSTQLILPSPAERRFGPYPSLALARCWHRPTDVRAFSKVNWLIGFAGVALGACLSWLVARDASHRQQEHEKKELLLRRREDAAADLRGAVDRIQRALPRTATGTAILPLLGSSSEEIEVAGLRVPLLREQTIAERFDALHYGMSILSLDAEEAPDESINPWAVGYAVGDLRTALDAFVLREPYPDPLFPTHEELRDLVSAEKPVNFPAVNAEMRRRLRERRAS